MPNCADCNVERKEKPQNEIKMPEVVPGAVYELEMARGERHAKRWMIAFFVALAMLFTTNAGWIIYESQFETYYYEQDGEGGNNMNVDIEGDVYNGTTPENQEETQK